MAKNSVPVKESAIHPESDSVGLNLHELLSEEPDDVEIQKTLDMYKRMGHIKDALTAIPESEVQEMYSDFRFADRISRDKISSIVTKWIMIGEVYLADPNFVPRPRAGTAKGIIHVPDSFYEAEVFDTD